MRSSGRSLLTLINDILDFSKIEAGGLELESIDFKLLEVIEEALDAVALQAAEKGLRLLLDLDPQAPPQARGDPARLRQVLVNLLGNAVKFTLQGEISLRAAATPASGGTQQFEFAIRDTGIGIAHERIDTLFTPFKQADSSITRRFGGTGLGLSISKHLAEAMGGGSEVESAMGEGSTFRLRVRMSQSWLRSICRKTHADAVRSPVTVDVFVDSLRDPLTLVCVTGRVAAGFYSPGLVPPISLKIRGLKA